MWPFGGGVDTVAQHREIDYLLFLCILCFRKAISEFRHYKITRNHLKKKQKMNVLYGRFLWKQHISDLVILQFLENDAFKEEGGTMTGNKHKLERKVATTFSKTRRTNEEPGPHLHTLTFCREYFNGRLIGNELLPGSSQGIMFP